MSDRPETTDDIIREMRDLGALDAQCNDMIPRSLQALGLRTYAARLEAATERERIQRNKVSFRCGDCARFGGDCDAGDSDGNDDRVACEKFVRRAIVPGNAAAMRSALSDACYAMFNFLKTQSGGYEEMAIALDKARAALAAPPRNCDRFAKWHEAWDAFVAEYGGPTDPGETEYYFGVWLFAPAEGKEASNG